MTYSNVWARLFKAGFSVEKLIIFVIAIICGIASVVFMYRYVDVTPATFEDYAVLNNRLEEIQGKPEEFLKENAEISVYNGKITYKIQSDECKMTGTYNENLELVKTSSEDKSSSVFRAVIGLICVCGLAAALGGVVLYLVVFLGEVIVISAFKVGKASWELFGKIGKRFS